MKQITLSQMQEKAVNCLHHRGEIVLIDRVLECTDLSVITQSEIKESNPFLKNLNGGFVFPIYQGIELIAQSLGCYQKIYQSTLQGETKAKIGFLLSARNFEIYKPYAEIGQTILTKVVITTQDEQGFAVCEGKIYFDYLDEKNLACQSSVSVLSPQKTLKEIL